MAGARDLLSCFPDGSQFGRLIAFASRSASPRGLQPINSRQRQHTLKDRRQAEQRHQQFEKACQAGFIDKPVNGPKTNCTDDADNHNPDQE
jgi:hypothetical protein